VIAKLNSYRFLFFGTILAYKQWNKKNVRLRVRRYCYAAFEKRKFGGYAVKDILLIGELETKDAFFDELMNEGDFRIQKTDNPIKALKLLKKNNPDYFICTGKMKATKDGKYFLDLEN